MLDHWRRKITLPPAVHTSFKVLQVLNNDMNRCDLFRHASAMAYVTLFSLIPSLAATFGLVSLFSPFLGEDSSLLVKAKSFILANLAPGSGAQILTHIDKFLMNLDMTKIGLTGIAGLLVALIMLLRQIEMALNRIWLVQKPRHIVTRFIHFWTFLTLGTVLAGLAIGILSGFDLSALNPFDNDPVLQGQGMLGAVASFLFPLIFFTLIYKIVPNTSVRLKDALWGAVPATILFTIASGTYGFFTANFTNYKAIYGALAAIPVFLMWLYILWLIILFGALLSWRMQQSFSLDERVDDQNPALSAREKLCNHHIQGALPLVCLLAIYECFLRADGKGISGTDLTIKLNLGSPWVYEALEVLLGMNLVVQSSDYQSEAGTAEILEAIYFPALPPEKISLVELRRRFSAEAVAWLTSWNHDWPVNFKPIIVSLWQSDLSSTPQHSVADAINECSRAS